MADAQVLASDLHDHAGELVYRDHLVRADVQGPRKARPHQPPDALHALVDVEEGPGLPPVAEDFYLAPLGGLRHLAAQGGRRFLPSPLPRALRAEDVVEPGHVDGDVVVPVVGRIEPLAEQLLPPVLAVRRCRVGGVLGAVGVVRVDLVVGRVDAGRAGVEVPPDAVLLADLQHVQVDGRGVVHDGGVVVPAEHVLRPSHVGGKLVNLVEPAVERRPAGRRVPEVPQQELVRRRRAKLVLLDVHPADPVPLQLEPLHQVAPDEAPCPAYQRFLHVVPPCQIIASPS